MAKVCEKDIRAAMLCGLTGFQFYYPFGEVGLIETYARRIQAYAEAVHRLGVDFKITLCFANADHPMSEADKIQRWAPPTRRLLEATPPEVWLKTPSGRHVFFAWMADGLADEISVAFNLHQNGEKVKYAALAYENLSKALGVETAFVQLILNYGPQSDPRYLGELLNHFPALWGWCQLDYSWDQGNIWDALAKTTRQRGREYTQTATLDFYSSKTFAKGTWRLIFDIQEALELGVDQQYRHTMDLELSKGFRQALERGIRQTSGLINIATWNDFAEGHHLSPDINHNFGFSVLLNYYKRRWLQPTLPPVEREALILFYKKYPSTAEPQFDYEMHHEGVVPPSASDFIELVALLKASGSLYIKGQWVGDVEAGLQVVRIPTEPGKVWAEMRRRGEVVLRLDSPQPIVERPLRTDRTTYSISTERESYLQALFGEDRSNTIAPWLEDGEP
jgi:hypothetical protein